MTLPRRFRMFSLALLLGAAAGTSAHDSSTYVQSLQESLADFSVSDFAASGSNPVGFRNVDLRYRENDHGARSYMLCGQARIGAGTEAEWVDFVTIKTVPYEQWLGSEAIEACASATPISPGGSDLSALIHKKLEHGKEGGSP